MVTVPPAGREETIFVLEIYRPILFHSVIRPAATLTMIEATQHRLSFRFPCDYINLFLEANGFEALVGERGMYLLFYDLATVEEVLDAELEHYDRRLIFIASNGSDRGFAYHRDSLSPQIVEISISDFDLGITREIGSVRQLFELARENCGL